MEQAALLEVLYHLSENNKLQNKTKISEMRQSYRFPQVNVHFRTLGNVLGMLRKIKIWVRLHSVCSQGTRRWSYNTAAVLLLTIIVVLPYNLKAQSIIQI